MWVCAMTMPTVLGFDLWLFWFSVFLGFMLLWVGDPGLLVFLSFGFLVLGSGFLSICVLGCF